MVEPKGVVKAGSVRFGNALPLVLIAGPCQMESRQHAFDMAGALKEICQALSRILTGLSRSILRSPRPTAIEAAPNNMVET